MTGEYGYDLSFSVLQEWSVLKRVLAAAAAATTTTTETLSLKHLFHVAMHKTMDLKQLDATRRHLHK